jgi:hypothetical protein
LYKNPYKVIELKKPVLNVKSKKRPTGTQILSRRKEMIKFNRLGLKPKEWIPKVAAKFDASEETVKRDWSNRRKWMNMYFQTTEVQTLGLDTLYDYEIASQEAAKLYYETENPKLKPTTLGLWMKAIKMKHDFFDKFGVLTRLRNQYYEEVKRRKD